MRTEHCRTVSLRWADYGLSPETELKQQFPEQGIM